MDYERALAFLESPARFSPRLGLARIERLLELLGNPQESFPSALVAGTSGKGSSCRLIASVLSSAGFHTGLLSKPHLQSYRERVEIDGQRISKSSLAAIVERIVPLAQELAETPLGAPTYFEMGVALAFSYFAQERVELAVVEVGLGGRLDATNVLRPILTGITPIGFDHTEYLGHTLTEIAGEKAGILKPGVPVALAPQHPEALAAIRRRAAEVGSPVLPSENWQAHRNSADLHGQRFDLEQVTLESGSKKSGVRKYGELFLPLLGRHQLENAAFALTALGWLREEGFGWEEKHLRQGWADLCWPGRAEVLQEGPLLVIDAAHNPDKAAALAETIRDYFSFRRLALVFGASGDKDAAAMLALFAPWRPRLFATQAQSQRALAADQVLALGAVLGLSGTSFPRVTDAVQQALRWADPQDMALVAGSTYVAGEARDLYFPADAE